MVLSWLPIREDWDSRLLAAKSLAADRHFFFYFYSNRFSYRFETGRGGAARFTFLHTFRDLLSAPHCRSDYSPLRDDAPVCGTAA